MHVYMVMGIAVAAFGATMIGGLLALRLRDKLHLILGFSAGAILAVAFFDLLPEALELGSTYYTTSFLLATTAIGFFLYTILDRVILLHSHSDNESDEVHAHTNMRRGVIGAGSLSSHSFLDGFAIGLAFQASPAIGAIVAAAVLTHDFSDGINTVNMILKNGGSRAQAYRWLAIDAVAPILGAATTLFITLPANYLAVLLALFAGFFLYIGAADLLPESHHAHPKILTTVMTLLGAVVLYGAVSFAGI